MDWVAILSTDFLPYIYIVLLKNLLCMVKCFRKKLSFSEKLATAILFCAEPAQPLKLVTARGQPLQPYVDSFNKKIHICMNMKLFLHIIKVST